MLFTTHLTWSSSVDVFERVDALSNLYVVSQGELEVVVDVFERVDALYNEAKNAGRTLGRCHQVNPLLRHRRSFLSRTGPS